MRLTDHLKMAKICRITLNDLDGWILRLRLLGGGLFGRRQDLLAVGLRGDGDASASFDIELKFEGVKLKDQSIFFTIQIETMTMLKLGNVRRKFRNY